MNKKKQIQFNLNNFFLSISLGLDAVSQDVLNTKVGHSKRVAYIAIKLAQEFNYSHEGLSDLCAYSLFHSIALKKSLQKDTKYCSLSNEYVSKFPFLCEEKDILKYQCENYDGSGIYGLKAEEIPLFSQFIAFASFIDIKFDLSSTSIDNRVEILEFIERNENKLFSTDIVECFTEFSKTASFWLDLQNENELLSFIFSTLHDTSIVLDFEELLKLTSVFTELIDDDLYLIDNTSKMADFYNFEHKDKQTFLLSASMLNIGKLFINSDILNKNSSLNKEEYELIKAYPYYTKKILSNIIGFNDITTWASKVQESASKDGYPYNLEGKDLSFKDRLLAVINAFSALTSNKPYRNAFSKKEAIQILKDEEKFDLSVIKDLEKVLV